MVTLARYRYRMEGGIPALVELLDSTNTKVQRAAAGALRTLTFMNEDNKNQVLDMGLFSKLFYLAKLH